MTVYQLKDYFLLLQYHEILSVYSLELDEKNIEYTNVKFLFSKETFSSLYNLD